MSPSAAVQMCPDQPVTPIFAIGANGNVQHKTQRPRRRVIKTPLPPKKVRSLAQNIQAADEHWQELVEAHDARNIAHTKESDLALLVAFSCFLHAMVDDRNLCGQMLNYFDQKLDGEVKCRVEPVK